MRDLIARGALVHDGSVALTTQATDALVIPGSAGLVISPRSPRTDLLRATAWAAHRLATEGSAVPFAIL